jgi:ATP-dependent helicase/nuclease subunit B
VRLFHLPPGAPFLDVLARSWLAAHGGVADGLAHGLILLPTRRAARALAESFLRAGDGRPMLLPRIAAIGALDEVPLTLTGALTLPPAVEAAERLAVLTRMILAMGGHAGAPQSADRAWRLAEELAVLMDEAERAEINLASRLPDAADPHYAEHWNQTLKFLQIVTRAWPDWLAAQGMLNPAERQVRLMDAQAQAWQDAPPAWPIWVAGTTGGMPALARLLRVVAGLPAGAVVLPGLDVSLDEAAWMALDASAVWPAAAADGAGRAAGGCAGVCAGPRLASAGAGGVAGTSAVAGAGADGLGHIRWQPCRADPAGGG